MDPTATRRTHPLAWTLALLGAGAILLAFTQPGGTPQPPRVALVDVFVVLDSLLETKDLKKKLDDRGSTIETQLKEKDARLKGMREDIKQLKPDDPTLRDKLFEFRKAEESLKAEAGLSEQLLNLEGGDMLSGLYDRVIAAVGVIAARDKFDLVLLDDRSRRLPEQGNDLQMRAGMERKRILYAAPTGLDITQQVINTLNNDYSTGKKK